MNFPRFSRRLSLLADFTRENSLIHEFSELWNLLRRSMRSPMSWGFIRDAFHAETALSMALSVTLTFSKVSFSICANSGSDGMPADVVWEDEGCFAMDYP